MRPLDNPPASIKRMERVPRLSLPPGSQAHAGCYCTVPLPLLKVPPDDSSGLPRFSTLSRLFSTSLLMRVLLRVPKPVVHLMTSDNSSSGSAAADAVATSVLGTAHEVQAALWSWWGLTSGSSVRALFAARARVSMLVPGTP